MEVEFVAGGVCGILQGCVRMTTTALQQLIIFIALRLVVQVPIYSEFLNDLRWFHKLKFTDFVSPSRFLLFGPLCRFVVCDWSE